MDWLKDVALDVRVGAVEVQGVIAPPAEKVVEYLKNRTRPFATSVMNDVPQARGGAEVIAFDDYIATGWHHTSMNRLVIDDRREDRVANQRRRVAQLDCRPRRPRKDHVVDQDRRARRHNGVRRGSELNIRVGD